MNRIFVVAVVVLTAACSSERRETSLGRQEAAGGGGGQMIQQPGLKLACGAPTVFSTRHFHRVVRHGTDLFGVEPNGALVRMPLDGSAEEVLETSTPTRELDGRLAATSEGLYFTFGDGSDGLTVAFRPFSAGPSTAFFTEKPVAQFATDELHVAGERVLLRLFDTKTYQPTLHSLKHDDARQGVAIDSSQPFTTDGNDLFFVDSSAIMKLAMVSGALAVKVADKRDVSWLWASGDSVFVADYAVPRGIRQIAKAGGEWSNLVTSSRDVIPEVTTRSAGVTWYAMYGDSQVAVFQKPDGKPASRVLGAPYAVLDQLLVLDDAIFVAGLPEGLVRVARTCSESSVTPVAGAQGYDDDFCFASAATDTGGRCDLWDGTKYVNGPACAAGGTCTFAAGSAMPVCTPAPTACEAVPGCGNVTCGAGCSCLNSGPSQCYCR